VAFLKDVPFFAGAAGTIHRLDNGHKTTEAHDGLLSLVVDEANDTLLTGGYAHPWPAAINDNELTAVLTGAAGLNTDPDDVAGCTARSGPP